ncbi:hypothetical protein [Vogesella sp. AC12]|uniref:hypothetical protein n=1 Tax=Vogesella sp. AC12 TaxID=2950550 RepID=UPI00210B7409|nr:hypothetical protein [Vogesella sp. AC12]MCQ4143346.1 hypothetical protein [Vogesella sp. AC12]
MFEFIAGVERVVIVMAGAFFAYLGYRLYLAGLTKGVSKLAAKSSLGEFAVSGTGPGLLFMAFGGAVLIYALATSGVRSTVTEQIIPSKNSKKSEASASETILHQYKFESSAPAMTSKTN